MTLRQIFFTLGLNSNTIDNKHIIMLDYDISDINTIRNEIILNQDKFKLSNFYILQSTTGFNAFCLDKITLYEMKLIYLELLNMDNDFKEMTFKRKYSTIRIGNDKKHILTLTSLYNEKEKSLAHKIALKQYYHISISDIINFDCFKTINVCQYENYKYGSEKPFRNIPFKRWID